MFQEGFLHVPNESRIDGNSFPSLPKLKITANIQKHLYLNLIGNTFDLYDIVQCDVIMVVLLVRNAEALKCHSPSQKSLLPNTLNISELHNIQSFDYQSCSFL